MNGTYLSCLLVLFSSAREVRAKQAGEQTAAVLGYVMGVETKTHNASSITPERTMRCDTRLHPTDRLHEAVKRVSGFHGEIMGDGTVRHLLGGSESVKERRLCFLHGHAFAGCAFADGFEGYGWNG